MLRFSNNCMQVLTAANSENNQRTPERWSQRVFMKGVGTARPQFWSDDASEKAGDEAVPAPVKGLHEYALPSHKPFRLTLDRALPVR